MLRMCKTPELKTPSNFISLCYQTLSSLIFLMQETNLTEMAQDHPGFERAVELAIGEHEEMSMRFVSRSSSASTKTNLNLPPKSTSPRPPRQAYSLHLLKNLWDCLITLKNLLCLDLFKSFYVNPPPHSSN